MTMASGSFSPPLMLPGAFAPVDPPCRWLWTPCLTPVVSPRTHTQQTQQTRLGIQGPSPLTFASPVAQHPLPNAPPSNPVLSSSKPRHGLTTSAALPMAFLLYSVQLFKEVDGGEHLAPGKGGNGTSVLEISCSELFGVTM